MNCLQSSNYYSWYSWLTNTIATKLHYQTTHQHKFKQKIPLPHPNLQLYEYVDFFSVNQLPFLHTRSSKLDFLTIQIGEIHCIIISEWIERGNWRHLWIKAHKNYRPAHKKWMWYWRCQKQLGSHNNTYLQ